MGKLDIRNYLKSRDELGQLFRVPFEIETLDEMGAFIARADYQGIHKPILFEKPAGFDIPLLANTVGHTYRAMAEAFGVEESNALPGCAQKTMEVLQPGGIAPMEVDCTVPLSLKVMDRVVCNPDIEARVDKLWSKL